MKYNFKEKNLSRDFAAKQYKEVRELIDIAGAFTIIGIPSVGVSLFLKYLTTRNFAYFLYLDLYSLSEATVHELYVLLAKELGHAVTKNFTEQELLDICKKRLQLLVKRYKHIIVIVNRFEELEEAFSKKFFGTLRILRHGFNNSVTLIFSVTKPYHDVASHAIEGGNLYFFTKYYYLKPFIDTDLKSLLALQSPELTPNAVELQKALYLAGGHFQLLQLLLKTEQGKIDPLKDPFIKLSLKQIYENFSYEQKRQLQKLALGKETEIDMYLVNTGLIKPVSIIARSEATKQSNKKIAANSSSSHNDKTTYKLFSPLLKEYIISQIPLKLPIREQLLFNLLKKQKGKIVSKDTIFQTVWRDGQDDATDWALDSLVYRLRRNPAFKQSGFVLESYKKQGYALVKTS